MPNDAKLGLMVGLGLVIAVAVVFFRKEPGPGQPFRAESAALGARTVSPPAVGGRGAFRPVPGKGANRDAETTAIRRHTVQEGDTLFSLAERYYGSREMSAEIYRVNRQILTNSEQLTPGTVLEIPTLTSPSDQQP
jgi:nucleoid-associated protein YgaU